MNNSSVEDMSKMSEEDFITHSQRAVCFSVSSGLRWYSAKIMGEVVGRRGEGGVSLA